MRLSNDLNSLISQSAEKESAVTLSLCARGTIVFSINEQTYAAGPNDLFIHHSSTPIKPRFSEKDFESYNILFPLRDLNHFTFLPGNNWSRLKFFEEHPVISLSDEESWIFRLFYQLIDKTRERAGGIHQKEQDDSLAHAFIYWLHDILELKNLFQRPDPFTSGERLLNRFIDLISKSEKKRMRVNDYARMLNISATYLTSICKTRTGHTPTEIITQYVLKDVDRLLREPDISIKEIAFLTGFSDQSSLGKYVKKHFGSSPQAYRKRISLGGEDMGG